MKNIEEPWKYLHEQIRATETEFGHLPRRTGWKKYFKQNPLEFKTHRRKNAAESQRKQSYILVDVFSTCFHSRKHRTLENRKKNMKTKPNIWSIVETSTSHCLVSKLGIPKMTLFSDKLMIFQRPSSSEAFEPQSRYPSSSWPCKKLWKGVAWPGNPRPRIKECQSLSESVREMDLVELVAMMWNRLDYVQCTRLESSNFDHRNDIWQDLRSTKLWMQSGSKLWGRKCHPLQGQPKL